MKISSGHCLKMERWQGPPHINTVKEHEIVLSFKISLSIQYLSTEVIEDLSPLIKLSSLKLQSAPLMTIHDIVLLHTTLPKC